MRLGVAVNLSVRNLLDAEFPERSGGSSISIGSTRRCSSSRSPRSIVLSDPVRTKRVLDKLSAMGIRLSIDDFGTGYSSLAYLQPPSRRRDQDRPLVRDEHGSCDNDAVIVRSTIDLGRNLGLQVVAEGVETEQAWDELSQLGCNMAQGYYLSRPVPAAELTQWMRRRPLEAGGTRAKIRRVA